MQDSLESPDAARCLTLIGNRGSLIGVSGKLIE
jgi:hypothetical protein